MNKITLQLTSQEAESFKTFREYQHYIEVLIENGVFDLKNGKATMTFNHEGSLMGIKTETVAYKRRSL